MKNYNDFINNNKLNEEVGVYGMLKNMFSKFLANLDQKFKKPLEELLNKLNISKDINEMKKHLMTYLKIHSDTMKKDLDETKDTSDVIKLTKDNLTAIYSAIDSFVKIVKEDKYTFEKIFEESKNENWKKLISQDEKYFDKNIDVFTRDLVIDIAKPFGFDPKKITSEWETINKNPKKVQEGEKENTKAQETVTDANSAVSTIKTPEDKEQPKVQEPQKEVDDNMVKLQNSIMKWFDITIYQELKKLLKEKEDDTNLMRTLQDNIDKMEATDKKDSVSKILSSITQIKDKKTLIELRDFLNSKGININKNNAPL